MRDEFEALGVVAGWARGISECPSCGEYVKPESIHQYPDAFGNTIERCNHPICRGRIVSPSSILPVILPVAHSARPSEQDGA